MTRPRTSSGPPGRSTAPPAWGRQDFLVAVTEVVANALQHGDTIRSGPNGTVVRFTIGR